MDAVELIPGASRWIGSAFGWAGDPAGDEFPSCCAKWICCNRLAVAGTSTDRCPDGWLGSGIITTIVWPADGNDAEFKSVAILRSVATEATEATDEDASNKFIAGANRRLAGVEAKELKAGDGSPAEFN